MSSSVYIVILNFNSWIDSLECVKSILDNGYGDYRTVIVDNNSTDGSADKLASAFRNMNISFADYSVSQSADYEHVFNSELRSSPRLVIIRNDNNNGFSAGNNVGIKYGLLNKDAAYFWLLNNDTVIHPNALSQLVSSMSDHSVGIVGSKLLYYHDRSVIQTLGNDNISWKGIGNGCFDGIADRPDICGTIETKSVIGASMLVRRELVEKVGLMDENYFMYHEESDWCERSRRYGYRLVTNCRSIVYHKEGGSTGRCREVKSFLWMKASRTTISDFLMWGYYSVRNEIYFVRKNFPAKFYLYFLFRLPVKLAVKCAAVFIFNDDYKVRRLYLILSGVYDGLTGKMGKTIDPLLWRKMFR